MNALAAKTAVKEPIIKYGFIGKWDQFVKIVDCKIPDIYLNVNERRAAFNIIKLDVDMEVFGLRYIQPGLNHRKLKKSQLKFLDTLIIEEQKELREELV